MSMTPEEKAENDRYERVLAALQVEPTAFDMLHRTLGDIDRDDLMRQLRRLHAEGKAEVNYGFGWQLTEKGAADRLVAEADLTAALRDFVQMVVDLPDGPDTSNCETLSAVIERAGQLLPCTEQVTLDLQIENTYEDGEEVITTPTVTVPVPPWREDSDEYDEWRQENIFAATGTGREDGDSWYDVKVTASSAPHIIPVGTTWEFGY